MVVDKSGLQPFGMIIGHVLYYALPVKILPIVV